MWKCQFFQFMNSSAHRQCCVDCQAQTQQAALAERLLAQRAQAINRQSPAPAHDFIPRLSARLRAETAPYLTTWEHALPSMRGWVVTFSAAALLLTAVAATLALNPDKPEEHAFTASATETVQNDAFWMGD